MGSSKRLSRSSTARSLVMTMLDTRCRSKDEFAEVRRLLRGEVVQPQVIEGKQLGGKARTGKCGPPSCQPEPGTWL